MDRKRRVQSTEYPTVRQQVPDLPHSSAATCFLTSICNFAPAQSHTPLKPWTVPGPNCALPASILLGQRFKTNAAAPRPFLQTLFPNFSLRIFPILKYKDLNVPLFDLIYLDKCST